MLFNWKKTGLLFAVCPLTGQNFKILGGVNEIPDKSWKALAPSFKAHIDAGNIVELQGKTNFKTEPVKDKAGKDTKEVKTKVELAGTKAFSDLSNAEKAKMIKGTTSIEQLEAWKEDETSESTRLAIAKRIEKVLNPPDED